MVPRRYAVPDRSRKSRGLPRPAPLSTVARLCRAGVRLSLEDGFLLASVPPEVAASERWPKLDRLLARHAAWLADAVVLIEMVRKRWTAEQITAHLRGLSPGLTELVTEIVGGSARLAELLAGPVTGANLDLVCFAYAEARMVEAVVNEPDDTASSGAPSTAGRRHHDQGGVSTRR